MCYYNIIREADFVYVETDESYFGLECKQSGKWEKEGIIVEFAAGVANQQTVKLTSPASGIKRVHVRWKLNIDSKVKILGDAFERGYGDLEWKNITLERLMPWYMLINDGQTTDGYGVKTSPNAIVTWQVDTKGISLWMDVRCGGVGVQLGEKVLEAATIIMRQGREGESAFEAARTFCKEMCDAPILPSKPVYGGNNWYYAYGNSSHEEIVNDTKLIAELAEGLENRPFMVIDDGWQSARNHGASGGPWKEGNEKFPDMKKLAEEIKEMNVRPGIWTRPLLTTEAISEDWVLPNKRFKGTPPNDLLDKYMDPSHPGVLEKVAEDFKRVASWGYELIKHDFSTYDIFGRWGFEMGGIMTNSNWSFYDKSKTTAEIITGLYKTIKNAVGKEVLIIGCNTVSHLAAGVLDMQRTGDDTSGRQWERTRKMGVNTVAFRNCQHSTFYAVDGDCVGLTRHVDWFFNKQWLDLLAKSGTPLFVSASPDAVGPEQKEALREAFKIASQEIPVGEPLDWLTNNCPDKWKLNGETVEYDWYGEHGMFIGTSCFE